MNTNNCSIFTLLLLGVVLLFCSCTANISSETLKRKEGIHPVSCVVMLVTYHYQGALGDVDLQDKMKQGVHFLDMTVKEQLQNSPVETIIESSQLVDPMGEVKGGRLGSIRKVGAEAGCQTILLTTLYEFTQRQGGDYAVDVPASVAFDMKLIDAESGENLWSASFNETQSTLLSNIFSFNKAKSRGFKWITVEELTAQGVHEKLAECPYLY